MPRRAIAGDPIWVVYLVAGALAALVFAVGLERGSTAQNLWYDAIGASAVVAILLGVRRHRPASRWAWRLMALGQASFVVGDLIWSWYDAAGESPFPSIGDVFYLAGYPILALGLILAIRRRLGGGDRTGLLDAAILAIGLSLVSWVFLIAPLAGTTTTDPLGFVVSLAYPVGDVLLIGVAMGLATAPGARVPSFWFIAASLTALLVADQVYVLQNLAGTYEDGGALDLLWVAAYLLWGAAALHPSMVRVVEPEPAPIALLGPVRLGFLGAAMLVGPFLLTVSHEHLRPELVVVALATGLLSLLVLVRLAVVVRALARDLERRRRLEDQLTFQAYHDPLTGVANRRRFVGAVVEAIALRREPGLVNVLFLDLDDFKTVNDSLGHAAGDELLQAVAIRIREAVRASDVVGRLGGDEFGVLLEPGSELDRVRAVAERLLETLRQPLDLHGHRVRASGSIGIATDNAATMTADDILRDADIAMYRAKASGKDRVLVFDPAANWGSTATTSRAARPHVRVPRRAKLSTDPA